VVSHPSRKNKDAARVGHPASVVRHWTQARKTMIHASDLAGTRMKFKPGLPLRIGGMTLDHPEGLAGHSDGDVAAARGDRRAAGLSGGRRYRQLLSARRRALEGRRLGYLPEPGDGGAGARRLPHRQHRHHAVLAAPKIAPVAGEMRSRLADLLGVEIDQVSIKAKTPEGMNLDHVAQCHAVVLVQRALEPDDLKTMSAVMEIQRQLEDTVDDLLSSVHGVPKRRLATRCMTRRILRKTGVRDQGSGIRRAAPELRIARVPHRR